MDSDLAKCPNCRVLFRAGEITCPLDVGNCTRVAALTSLADSVWGLHVGWRQGQGDSNLNFHSELNKVLDRWELLRKIEANAGYYKLGKQP